MKNLELKEHVFHVLAITCGEVLPESLKAALRKLPLKDLQTLQIYIGNQVARARTEKKADG